MNNFAPNYVSKLKHTGSVSLIGDSEGQSTILFYKYPSKCKLASLMVKLLPYTHLLWYCKY